MGKRILNLNNCTFVCPSLQGVISKTQVPHNFNDGTGATLTQNTALSGNGICSILTAQAGGTPVPCTLVMAKGWISGIELHKRINGISLLNEDAKMPCTNPTCAGSIISVQKPLSPIIPAVVSASMANNVSFENKSLNKSATESTSEPYIKDNNDSVESDMNTNVPHDEVDNNDSDGDKKADENISEESSICSYSSCDKAESCPYMKASNTINTNGAAAKLRKNSTQKEKDYDEMSDKKMEKYEISWNNQAHHMISINAAYCQYPELVKLGNYFEYDINCQENCYFLPCWESGDGYGQKKSHFKKAQAYQVMNASGLQWHVGQHNYRIDIPENIREKYPELKTIDCYNDKINKEVKSLLSECNERFNGICLEEDYELHKSWFIKKMNSLSENIEEYLDLFSGNPKDSFPYFVSLEALRYAYEIPRSGKVVLAYRTETKWYLKRYKFTNNVRDPDIQVKLLDSKELAIADQRTENTINDIILFCENVSCFLIADETENFKLPFSYNVRYQYISDKERNNKESHFSAMLAEQADSGENEYEPPRAVVLKRLKECGLKK